MENTDRLARFKIEVLDNGQESCLPKNLTDYWLEILAEQADLLLNGNDENKNLSEVIAAVVCLQSYKNPRKNKFSFTLEEMHKFINMFNIELNIELVCRNSEFSYSQATLDSILTDRDVTFQRG